MLAKQSISVAIVLFWCVMTGLLIKRQIGAPPAVITLSGTDKITEKIEEWWGVFYRGEKIGYASQTITPKAKGYTLRDQSVLHLNLLGAVQPATTRLELQANEDWIMERFDFELSSKEIRFGARGAVRENKLALEVESADNKFQQEITLTQAPYLLAALKPYVVTQQLETGKKFHFSTFDPATLSQQVTTVVIEGREQIRVGERTEPAIKLRQSFRGISLLSWVDGQGRTLKEESPAGLSLVRQSAQEAKNLPSRGMSLDIVAQTAIPVAAEIVDAPQLGARVLAPEQPDHLLREVGGGLALGERHADQHVARGAEVLHLHLESAGLQRLADLLHVGAVAVVHLHERAAGELDREMQPLGGEEEHRQQERDERDHVEHQGVPHERDDAADLEEFHASGAHFQAVSPIDSFATRRRWP